MWGTGHRFEIRLKEHAKRESDRTTNSLHARHFIETGHTFINPSENVEILKIENNITKRKLFEESDIIKVKRENKNALMNIKIDFNSEEAFYHVLRDS